MATGDSDHVFVDLGQLDALAQLHLILGEGLAFLSNRNFMLDGAHSKLDPFD